MYVSHCILVKFHWASVILRENVGRGSFSSFDEDDELETGGWADCVWRESRLITLSHVGTPGGVLKAHPGAVHTCGVGGAIVSKSLVPGGPRQSDHQSCTVQ